MAEYKRCAKCHVEMKRAVPICFVCGTVQPGYEGADESDLAAYEAKVTEAELKHDGPKVAMIWIILGWCIVFLILALILVYNPSLSGPGGPH